MMVIVTVWPCTGNATLDQTYNPPCLAYPATTIQDIMLGPQMANTLQASGGCPQLNM